MRINTHVSARQPDREDNHRNRSDTSGPTWVEAGVLFVADSLPFVLVVAVSVYAILLLPPQGHGSIDLWYVVGVAAVSGLISCSILETAKRLLRLRGIYQKRQVRLWFAGRGTKAETGGGAVLELLQVASVLNPADSNRNDSHQPPKSHNFLDALLLFDLPIEQLSAQISEAVEAALEDPETYPFLYAAMIGLPPKDDDRRVERGEKSGATKAALRARGSVDLLQISVGNRWRRYISGTAVGLSGICGLVLTRQGASDQNAVVVALVSIFVGGFFAWTFRDMSAGLERWRRTVG